LFDGGGGSSAFIWRIQPSQRIRAAASFAALLLWLYYTSLIFLFGAEFTACLGGAREISKGHDANGVDAKLVGRSRSTDRATGSALFSHP